MRNSAHALATTAGVWMTLVTFLAGCAQVLDIEDWQQTSSGQGGAGGEPSASSAAGTQTGALSASAVSASAVSASAVSASAVSASAGAGGQGGQGGQTSSCNGTCAPPVPTDWEGPIAIFVGDDNAALPTCGPEWSASTDWATGMLIAPDPVCGSCSCSSPAGGQCSLTQVHIEVFDDNACSTKTATTPVTAPNTCTAITLGMASIPFRAKLTGQSLPNGSSCAPSGGAATKPPAFFDKQARICANPSLGTGCPGGEVCAPAPASPFYPGPCIYRALPDGVTPACPAGYDNPLPYLYTGLVDQRSCTPCQCGPASNQSCSMSASVYVGAGCTTSPYATLTPGACVQNLMTTNLSASAKVNPGAPIGGQCWPLTPTGIPMGGVYGTDRTLVCCQP